MRRVDVKAQDMEAPAQPSAFFSMEKRKYAIILAHKSKNNTLFVIVKGLLLFMCTENISKTFYKIYIYFKYISNISLLFLPTHSW